MTQDEIERAREAFRAVGVNAKAADAWLPLTLAAPAADFELAAEGEDEDRDRHTLRVDGLIFGSTGGGFAELFGIKGVSPEQVAKFLEEADGDEITLIVNSPGGDYFGGADIATQIVNYEGKVTAQVVGEAASAASLITAAADEVEVSPLAQIMIHGASSVTYGNAKAHRSQAERLDKIGKSAASIYETRSAKEDVKEWLFDGEDHWFTADEAVSNGFADRKTPLKSRKRSKAAKAAADGSEPSAAGGRAAAILSVSPITQDTMLRSLSKIQPAQET